MFQCSRHTMKGASVVAGGILVHLSLGTLYTFGNLNPYMTSYMRWSGADPTLTYTDCSWVFALACMGQGLAMYFGGLIERRIGPRLTSLIGGWLMSLGVMMTYFTIKQSFGLVLLTYGFLFGVGVGISYAIPLGCAMRWFPDHKGLVNGFVVAGFGGGSFIFDQVQTLYINPDNLKTQGDGDEKYFEDPTLLSKVPKVFLLLGGCYAVMQLLGSVLICNPPSEEDAVVNQADEGENLLTSSNENENDRTELLKDSDSDEINLTPMEVLKSQYFYILWFMFLCNGQGQVFIASLYKAYGQTFISDDSFMATVGSLAAVCNAFGRILWGMIADRLSFRVSMLLMTTSFTCLMLTLQLTSLGGRGLFLIYICLLFGSFSGSFALFPTAMAKCFGRKHMPMNYGLLFTSQVITAPLGTFMSQRLKSSIGWSGLFFLVSGFSFISFILTIGFRAKDKKGREI